MTYTYNEEFKYNKESKRYVDAQAHYYWLVFSIFPILGH